MHEGHKRHECARAEAIEHLAVGAKKTPGPAVYPSSPSPFAERLHFALAPHRAWHCSQPPHLCELACRRPCRIVHKSRASGVSRRWLGRAERPAPSSRRGACPSII